MHVKAIPNAELADSDYLVFLNEKFHHYLEVKCRRNDFNAFPDTIVPLRKHSTAEHYKTAVATPTYFLAAFEDGTLAALDLSREPDRILTQVARKDRNTDRDIYACYKMCRFYKLKT